MQKLSGTVRSFTVESVLPGKMVTGSKISPPAAMIRTATTCFVVVAVVVILFHVKTFLQKPTLLYLFRKILPE